MDYNAKQYYSTLSDEELRGIIDRMEARAARVKSEKAWLVALGHAKAVSEVLEEREES